jgi:TRAP transporter TAXI family solute receptor
VKGGNAMRKQTRLSIPMLTGIIFFVILTAFVESPAVAKPIKLTYGSTGMGSPPYIFSAAVAEAIKNGLPPGSSVMISSGEGFQNLARLESGDVEIAHQTTLTLFAGITGRKPFTSIVKNARLLSGITPPDLNEYHFVITKDCPINSFGEFLNKKYPLKLTTRTVGGVAEMMTDSVFRSYGFNYDDIKKWGGSVTFTAYSTCFELLKDGRVEAYSGNHTYPSALMTDMLRDRKVKWFSIYDEKVLAKLEEAGMFKVNLPMGHYGPAFDKEIVSICGPEVLAVNANVPDDIAYTMVKAICENAELIRSSHASVSSFSSENAYKWLVRFTKYVPLHPGAEKYFREKRYIK